MRCRALAAALVATTLAPPPAAADALPGLLDLVRPERLIERAVQSAVVALRTQLDITYGDLSVTPATGAVTLTDLRLRPQPAWDASGECEIAVDRLAVRGGALDRSGAVALRASAHGVAAPAVCLPPGARQPLAVAGLGGLRLPFAALEIDHTVASAETAVILHAVLADVAALDAEADIAYLSLDARDAPDEPEPVIFLRSATVAVENLGGWQAAAGLIPPPFAEPEQAGMAVEGMIGAALGGMNREAADPDAGGAGDPSALSPAQRAFAASVREAWGAFLADPRRLVLETGIPPGEDRFLDLGAYEADPRRLFEDLAPRLTLLPAARRALVPADRVRRVLETAGEGEAALAELPAAERREVGLALLTGVGAPRDLGAGVFVLSGLASEGDGAAALALSAALEDREPAQAYRWALRAGAAGLGGATARLDRLEAVLDLGAVLRLQAEASAGVTHPSEALARVGLIRAQARARLTGRGAPRSYQIAAMWARLAAAAGDAEGAAILAEIDARVRAAGEAGRAAWTEAERAATDLAMQAWVGRDLPGRLGGD